MTVTLGYFIVKMEALIKGSDPIINTNTIKEYYDADSEGLNLAANNLHFAISINLKLVFLNRHYWLQAYIYKIYVLGT